MCMQPNYTTSVLLWPVLRLNDPEEPLKGVLGGLASGSALDQVNRTLMSTKDPQQLQVSTVHASWQANPECPLNGTYP